MLTQIEVDTLLLVPQFMTLACVAGGAAAGFSALLNVFSATATSTGN